MKRLMVLCMAVAFVAAAMMGGCSTGKSFSPPLTGGSEGMAKQPIDMGKSAPSGVITGGSEGMAKPGVDMGKSAPSGVITGGSEGMAKPGVQAPQPK